MTENSELPFIVGPKYRLCNIKLHNPRWQLSWQADSNRLRITTLSTGYRAIAQTCTIIVITPAHESRIHRLVAFDPFNLCKIVVAENLIGTRTTGWALEQQFALVRVALPL